MTKLRYVLAVVGLICIITTASVPACLAARPFPVDEEGPAGVAETSVESATTDQPADSQVTSTSFSDSQPDEEDKFSSEEEENDDTEFRPCYATLAEIEGRTDPSQEGDATLVEVDCRRMLRFVDYNGPKRNKNPKCSKTKRKC
ncbi:hypothetical protein R1sor_017222 [Riccia sorocarpa]|uniref:Secreted protein n=1 Tax=Riccia sorocarpa TaxID=122646 RepID=A0ABD3I9Y9_9MARC